MEENMGTKDRDTLQAAGGREISLKSWFDVIKRRLWLVLLPAVLLGLLGGLISSAPQTPMYEASSRLVLSTDSADKLGTLRVFMREPVVLGDVIEELGLRESAGSLRSRVAVRSVDNSIITVVSVLDADPVQAPRIANAVVSAFTNEAAKRLGFTGVNVLTEAKPAEYPMPVNSSSNRALYLGIMAGLVIGLGLAFLRDSLDGAVRGEGALEALGIRPLGRVSRFRGRDIRMAQTKRKHEYIRGEHFGA
ncbi:YveK family protein [Paenibacillus glufosinatiresistens]|uniref:YveK family protein n=1 Tax=Paenibacillus glufosinatiresistens TaxID=3070657 RepID=UPI00286E7310|nr:hypothetical protein [Paenibacillus sp. YX.27]